MSFIKDYTFKSPEGVVIHAQIIKGYVALFIASDYWILAKGYKLYKFYPKEYKLKYFSKLDDKRTAKFAKFRLLRRALRAEITHLYKFGNDWFCIARKAIFRYDEHSGLFKRCHTIEKGSRPMNMCQDKDGTLYYGEYFFNPNQNPVKILSSKDNGTSWQKAYEFGPNEINHIHGLYFDKYTNRLWVFTGDDDNACIAGYTTDGFKTFIREFEGKQEYRICVPLFTTDSIIYSTDSQYSQNKIRIVNRLDKQINDIVNIQGSGIYSVDTGNLFAVSTTVEPSNVNLDQSSHLWYSFDGIKWRELISFKKDYWKTTLFQFGSIRFPHYETPIDSLVFTGRALFVLDQSTLIVPNKELQK